MLCLVRTIDREHARIAVEGGYPCPVARLHVAHVHAYIAIAHGPHEALRQRVRRFIEVVDDATCLESQPPWPFGQRPSRVDGVVVPLPVEAHSAVEVVAAHDACGGISLNGLAHHLGHAALFIPQHGPTVAPLAVFEGQNATYSPAVLED